MLEMQQETTVSIDAKNAEKIELSDKKVFTSKHEKILEQPFDYLMEFLSGNTSESLDQAFKQMSLKLEKDKLEEISQLVNSLSDASILIDDIEEEIALQNGVPGAHHIFGIPMAINTAHYMKIKAVNCFLKNISEKSVVEGIHIAAEQLLKYHEAEGLEIYLKGIKGHVDENKIKKLKAEKKQAFIDLGTRLAQLLDKEKGQTDS